jgi:zinc/manganese transport system substrate-binding protein
MPTAMASRPPRPQLGGTLPDSRGGFHRLAALLFFAALAAGLAACGDDDSGSGTTEVVATTGILADVAEQVAGGDAEVVQLIPDSADPHSFALSAEDRQTLEEAELVVANGAGLEAGVPIDEAESSWILTDHAGELLPFAEEEHAEEEHAEEGEEEHADDPHVWMDPTKVAAALPSLAETLGEADPEHADDYANHADEYAKRLRSLDREMRKTLDGVPQGDRELVTSHDSLSYFADRYGFEVIATAFPATGAEAEASAEDLAGVEEAVRESGVPAIFAQEGDDPEALNLVASDTGVELNYGLLVEAPGTAGTYEEMLRRDAKLIAQSLGG